MKEICKLLIICLKEAYSNINMASKNLRLYIIIYACKIVPYIRKYREEM